MIGGLALLALVGLDLLLRAVGAPAAAGAARLAFVWLAPGWLALRALRAATGGRADDPARGALLAPFLSAVPFAAATFLAVASGASLGGAVQGVWGACVVLVGACALWEARRRGPAPGRGALREAAILLAPAAAAALGATLLLLPEGTRFSYHGALHVGLVAQLTTGVVPPDHLSLGGAPIDFYWFFHWLLAAQVALTGLSALVCAPASAIVSLFVYVGASALVLRRFLGVGASAALSGVAGFSGNLLFPLAFAAGVWAAGGAGEAGFWPFQVLAPGVPGGDPRLVTLLAKFLNLNGFPMGLAAVAVALDALLPRQGADGARTWGWILLVALCHAILFHTTTALAAYLALPAAVLAREALDGGSPWRSRARRVAPVAAVFVAALALTGPYLHSIARGSPAFRGGAGEAAPLGLGYDLEGLLWNGAPVVAALLAAAVRTLRRRHPLGGSLRLLAGATFALLAATLSVPLPDHNEYKLLLVAFLPGGVLGLALLRDAGRGRGPGLAVGAALALALAGHALTAFAYVTATSRWRTDVVVEGAYLTLPREPELDAALRWLRANAPRDALVVTKPEPFGGSRVRAGSGRAVFVLHGGRHTAAGVEESDRAALVDDLLSLHRPLPPLAAALANRVDRPVYVLVTRRTLPTRFDAVTRRFAGAPDWLTPVRVGDEAALFALRLPGGPPPAARDASGR